jgi:sigma-E factor negative regulatory protein RseA
MTVPDRDALKALETLSAMADGEVDAQLVEQVCSSWRQDASVRARWHSYHLIGDVLRSEELGAGFKTDETMLQRVRERLAAEPVVLAPAAGAGAEENAAAWSGARGVISMSGRRRTWGAPIAVAAGFVAMAGLLVAVRQPSPTGLNGQQVSLMALPTPVLSAGGTESSLAQGLASNPGVDLTGQSGATLVVTDNVLRDAKLDRYLAAHQEFSGATALGESSGFMRSATYEVSPR